MISAGKERPRVLNARSLLIALSVHIVFFGVFWIFATVSFREKETVIPIDLTVIVNENLEGKEDEPPPLEESKPEPPPPPPKPEAKPPEPPPVVDEKVEALEKIKVKPEEKKKKPPEKKKKPEKKKEPEKPKPPKKSRQELLRERMERMRRSATTVKTPIVVKNRPSGDGRTAKKKLSDAEVRKLLNQGYRPGKTEQLASSERQRCLSLIQMALNEKWAEIAPPVERGGYVLLSVNFDGAGRMINCRLAKSSGNAVSDRAALTVASRVGYIAGLSPEFIAEFRRSTLTIRYKVEAR